MQVSQSKLMRLFYAVALYGVVQRWSCCSAQNSTVANGQAGQELQAGGIQVEGKISALASSDRVQELTSGVRPGWSKQNCVHLRLQAGSKGFRL